MNEETKILAAAGRGIIVSGKFNPRTQQVDPDLDGDAAMALYLLKLEGCKVGETTFVHPGSKADNLVREYPGQLILDVGGIGGIDVRDNGSVVIDHHDKDSTAPCTAWTLADQLGLAFIDGRYEVIPGLEQALEFVHNADTNQLPQGAFGKSARTIIGLSRYFEPEQVVAFFAEGNNLETVLSDYQLEELGLTEVSQKQKEVVDTAFAAIDAAQKVWIFSCKEDLKGVVVDRRVIGGSFAAYERGYNFFASFTDSSFAVNFLAPYSEVAETQKRLGEGKVVRGSMILCNEASTKHSFASFVEAIKGRAPAPAGAVNHG